MYNTIEREFNTEVKQMKSIARGAYHKKGGSKSKKCSLPSDNLTAAQKRKLNGPVETYTINQPMSWEAFKGMPLDLQQQHIDYVQSRFATGIGAVSKDGFGMSHDALRLHLVAHGLSYQKYGKGHRGDIDGLRLWATGCTPSEVEPAESPESSESVAQKGVSELPAAEKAESVKPNGAEGLELLPELFCGGKLCMSGTAKEVLPRLLTLIGNNDAWLSVHLSFTSRKDD